MCFGHQAVAQALGGRVEPSPKGWDVGVRTLEWTPQARGLPGLRAAPEPLRIYKLHADVVTRLPPGAVPLARSAHAEHEAFALGTTTLCLQGHAEFDAEVLREALDRMEAAHVLPPERAEACRATLPMSVPRAFWELWLRSFFAAGGLAEPVVARAAAAGARR
jgi:GMP synthase-like glutamine amidotransferase